MAPLRIRAASTTSLSTTALAAVLTGVGVVMSGFLIGLVVLLVRAVRNHKRLLADLEGRGVVIAQSQKDAKRESVRRPRAVLRRNTILPFNTKSGWGALPSVETINPPEPPSIPPHYVPPKPVGFVSKSSRLSWPFTARRASGKAVRLRKIRVPILSTVIESPKSSPLVPVLSGSLGGDPPSPRKNRSRPTSDQSLLQRHPAFRDMSQEGGPENDTAMRPEPFRRSLTAKPVTKTEMRVRSNRSKSVAEIPMSTSPGTMSPLPCPKLRARSASMCSQSSGNAPEAPAPPLPLDVARIKGEARRRSLLSQSPSQLSVSSLESVGSSILATQSSPILPHSANMRIQKVMKRDWRNSMIVGPRPNRDTLTLHGKNQRSQSSIKSSAARFSSVTPTTQGPSEIRSSIMTHYSNMQSIGKVKTAESVTLSKVSSPTCSPLTVRSSTTPRRKSNSHVTAYGSPEERHKGSHILQSGSGNYGAPKRQLSHASTQASSTRSSNGNPFQWDPTPLSSGKPSALKGSPSARKGHRRQTCVRLSLAPTILGPPSRPPSPTAMKDIQGESSSSKYEKRASVGSVFSNMQSLPRAPSTSIFAPDIKLTATSIRASLTPSSPTLSMANYDYGHVGSPRSMNTAQGFPALSAHESKRLSTGSIFTIPTFPSPCHGFGSIQLIASPPPMFALPRPSNEHGDELRTPDSPIGPSSPFEVFLSPGPPLLTDEHGLERPLHQTPASSPPVRNFSSPFSTIPEESSVTSTRTTNSKQLRSTDSPPCSPKTITSGLFLQSTKGLFSYNVPVKDTIIPEEPFLDTISPAILSKDAFSMLNSGFDSTGASIVKTLNSSWSSIPMPTSPCSARSMFDPLLEAAFPSSPRIQKGTDVPPSPPTFQSGHLSPGSAYDAPSPSSLSPCSPRPRHAQLPTQLPTPALDFADMPTLNPSPCGPRSSPPRPLGSSIQKLRRMNSDAEKGGRGERRYLRLGREDSIALPGEESWLDELEGISEDNNDLWNEEKSRQLVDNLLEDCWKEEESILTPTTTNNETPKPPHPATTTTSEHPREPSTPPDPNSSIWEDGATFWHSTPPHPPNSPNKPKQRFLSLSSSPVSVYIPKMTPPRKRDFEVAKDDASVQSETKGVRGRYRKRSALGIATPNIRIQVQRASGSLGGTPGSLYDGDGFLR